MNQYIVVKNQQIAIEANDPDEALRNALAGQGKTSGVSYNVQLRPPQPVRPGPTIVGGRPANG